MAQYGRLTLQITGRKFCENWPQRRDSALGIIVNVLDFLLDAPAFFGSEEFFAEFVNRGSAIFVVKDVRKPANPAVQSRIGITQIAQGKAPDSVGVSGGVFLRREPFGKKLPRHLFAAGIGKRALGIGHGPILSGPDGAWMTERRKRHYVQNNALAIAEGLKWRFVYALCYWKHKMKIQMNKAFRTGIFGVTILCAYACIGSTGAAQTHPADTKTVQKAAAMAKHATGTFDVKLNVQTDDKVGDPTVGRMSIDKQFHGDLEATSKGQMLSTLTEVKGSAGYVAIERVTGTLQGRAGSFSLQHNATMNRGVPELNVIVIPDSGTGQLIGLAGKLNIIIAPDGKHSYEFDYTLPDIAK